LSLQLRGVSLCCGQSFLIGPSRCAFTPNRLGTWSLCGLGKPVFLYFLQVSRFFNQSALFLFVSVNLHLARLVSSFFLFLSSVLFFGLSSSLSFKLGIGKEGDICDVPFSLIRRVNHGFGSISYFREKIKGDIL